eukprot:scaffold2243_cov75-Isochrysis_galbana.AAC.1
MQDACPRRPGGCERLHGVKESRRLGRCFRALQSGGSTGSPTALREPKGRPTLSQAGCPIPGGGGESLWHGRLYKDSIARLSDLVKRRLLSLAREQGSPQDAQTTPGMRSLELKFYTGGGTCSGGRERTPMEAAAPVYRGGVARLWALRTHPIACCGLGIAR